MRDPSERLCEIRKRADARIAAIRKRNRLITGICTTVAMCLMIGLGVHRVMSLPKAPPLIPPESTTICITTTTADSTTASQPSNTTPSSSQTDSTQSTVQTTQTDPPSSSATVSVTTATVSTVISSTTSCTVTTKTTADMTTIPSIQTTLTTTAYTTVPTVPTTTTAPYDDPPNGDGNLQQPPIEDSSTTTNTRPPVADWDESTTTSSVSTTSNDWELQDGTNPPPTTTTATVPPQAVVFTVSSYEDVSEGSIITVEVTVSDNHYLVAGQINLIFDSYALEPVSEIQSFTPTILSGACAVECHWPSEDEIQLRFSSSAAVGSAQGGTVLRMTFEVKEIGYGTTIYCEIPEMVSNSGRDDYNTPVIIQNGTISPPDIYWWL